MTDDRDAGAPGLAARKAALMMLGEVLTRRRPLDGSAAALAGLAPRDAGFARALASQALRHFGEMDALIRHCVPKPPPVHKAGAALEILLLGAAELLVLKSPAHAAVDGANRLARADAKAMHFKPLINAVLRRLAREGEGLRAGLDTPRLNTPDWLWARWAGRYGVQTAHAIATAHGREAPLDVVVKAEGAPVPGGTPLFGPVHRLARAGRIENLPGFAQGGWWVQDAAATLPARLLGAVAGKRVIDLCAAPGGKTLQLAAAGAAVTAIDSDAARLELLRTNLARTGLHADLIAADARDVRERAPMVLLDAPCTATGTIRRHPDLPWIKEAGDVAQRAMLARDILESAAALVEPGGLLVFAVCSLESEEGEDQIAAFLAANRAFARVPATTAETFGHAEWISPEGDLRTLPCHLARDGGMDGFYAARLRRQA